MDQLVELDVARMGDGELATDLVRLRRHADRIEAVLAAMTATAHRRGIGLADGHPSTPAWVAWRTGQSRVGVNRVIRLGELAELLPETEAAWRAGEITAAAVEMMASARVEGHDEKLAACEPELLRLARARDHRSLRVATAHVATCARADGSQPRDPDGLTLARVGDRTVVTGELSGDAAETVTHAISVFTPQPSDLPDLLPAQRRALALTRICEIALRHGTDAEGAKASVSYLTHQPDRDGLPGPTVGHFTGVLGPAERDRILCDCRISRVVMSPEGLPLDVGRASQTWPAAVRRAIVARDRGCQWPGCALPAGWCDAHHFLHWESGETAVTNGFLRPPTTRSCTDIRTGA